MVPDFKKKLNIKRQYTLQFKAFWDEIWWSAASLNADYDGNSFWKFWF